MSRGVRRVNCDKGIRGVEVVVGQLGVDSVLDLY
jgi:hypothetical protein